MKKLLFVVYSLQESNGTERAVVNLVNELVKYDYNITLLSIVDQNKKCSFSIDPGIQLKSLDIQDGSKIAVFYKYFIEIIKFINFNKFDVVFGSLVYINVLLSIISFFKKNRFYACEHATYEHPHNIVKIIRKFIYRFVDSIVVLNSIELDKFKKNGLNAYQIPNIVPIQNTFSSLNNKSLLCVSRMSHEKGIDLLLEVLKEFYSQKENQDIKTNIVGDGVLLDDMKEKAKVYEIDSYVSFMGKVTNINDYYLSSDIVLVTSRYESFGLSILEGMSFGLPVISFDIESGPKLLIENDINGYLIEKYNFEKYAEMIENVVHDIEKRKNLSQNAIKSSLVFSSINIIPQWIDLIEKNQ